MTRRRAAWTLTATTLVALLPAMAACGGSEDCAEENRCPTAGSGGSGASGSGGEGGQGGTGGSLPEGCQASPLADGSVIKDDCGVFVSATAAAGGDGTMDKPFRTIAEGVEKAGAKRIYVCGAQTFEEAVALDSDELIGGLRCDDGSWAYQGAEAAKRTILKPLESGTIALRIGGGGATVAGLSVIAPAGTEPGDSSIAVLVDGGTAKITDCDLEAQDTVDGADGAPPVGTGTVGENGDPGTDGLCMTVANLGGAGGEKICDGVDATGGLGGTGTSQLTGGEGGDGQGMAIAAEDGQGGLGQGASSCDPGEQGADGGDGEAGAGALTPGTLGAAGHVPSIATDGATAGKPGQGGGGGGGANECSDTSKAGPGGGGGGSGGCGGAAGKAGQSGGSSIGLVSANGIITLTRVTIATGKAGSGGDGGNGQEGGGGGQPGGATGDACGGGKGGTGGKGGPGGGGHGGHSLGIAWQGASPSLNTTTITPGDAGDGGIGGDGDTSPTVIGGNGQSCKRLDFGSDTCAND
jgi:hypothetical protein